MFIRQQLAKLTNDAIEKLSPHKFPPQNPFSFYLRLVKPKKALIITYYWPPAGGAGVQRWLKFVKYLRDFGWEPVVYTAQNGEVPILDASLEKDVPPGITVLKQPIVEPYSLYKRFIGQKKDEKINAGFLSESSKNPLLEKISVFVRGNVFIPDARMLWIRPSVKYLKAYLKENPVDVIISTGPPHSMHLIAMKLKAELGLPWLADFRDPWTNIDFYPQLMLTRWADSQHRKLEQQVIKNADALLVISRAMRQEFLELGAANPIVITNGFDDDDFSGETQLSPKFTLSHIGSMNKDRNSPLLWKVLDDICKENADFKRDFVLRLVGKNDVEVSRNLSIVSFTTEFVAYLPHDEVTQFTASSQVLLLPLNNTPNVQGILTGKLFEYLAARRPILCIGPPSGDCAAVISETQSGVVVNFEDSEGMKKAVLDFYDEFKSGTLAVSGKGVEKYSRRNLTKQLVADLDEIKSRSV